MFDAVLPGAEVAIASSMPIEIVIFFQLPHFREALVTDWRRKAFTL